MDVNQPPQTIEPQPPIQPQQPAQSQPTQAVSLNSSGIAKEKIEQELAFLNANPSSTTERIRNDLLGFDENMPKISTIMHQDRNFDVFDFSPKKEIYQVDIGPIEDELHYDVFDSLRVDNDLPFVVMNLNSEKILRVKGLYLSNDRVFKLYHSTDVNVQHEALIKDWSSTNKLNVPHTMKIKVLLYPTFRSDKNAYADVTYIFGEGLFIEFKDKTGDAEYVLSILQSHMEGFKPKSVSAVSISGSFVMDRLVVNPNLFRGILMESHNFRQTLGTYRPLRLYQFLWPNERGQALSLRKQFILNFKLGDVVAKIIISAKETKTSDLFYMNGVPIRFNPGTKYDLVRISDVKSAAHISLIREVLAVAFYLYGVQMPTGVKSVGWANSFNTMLGKHIFNGETFGPSKRITSKDLETKDKINARLRAIDPTFYGSIPTGKLISKGSRQPNPIVRVDDPNWQTKLWETIMRIWQEDSPSNRRQIIRYPFIITNPSDKDSSDVAETKVPPYFLICNQDSPFFKIKENKNPLGSDNTYHPNLIICTATPFIMTEGNTPQEQFTALADLSRPFYIQLITKQKTSGRGDHKYITLKILKEGRVGVVPESFKVVLNYLYEHPSRIDLMFERYGSPRSNLSLLHVLVTNSIYRSELRTRYMSLFKEEEKEAFLETVVKRAIAKETNWNLARQELFDMEPVEDSLGSTSIQTLFLSKGTHIDSRLFKTVLEKFFNMFILVISFDKKKTKVEIPRHKFLHISSTYPANVQPIVVFKHSDSDSRSASQYELVRMMAKSSLEHASNMFPWTFGELKMIFDLANKTLDISFLTIHRLDEKLYETGPVVKSNANIKPMLTDIFDIRNIQYQYVDGAGKARAMVYTFLSELHGTGGITVTFEPLCPIAVDAFDSLSLIRSGYDISRFMLPEDFERAMAFVKSLGLKNTDIAYKLMPEDLEYVYVTTEAEEKPVFAAGTVPIRVVTTDKGKEEFTTPSNYGINREPTEKSSLKSKARPRIKRVSKQEGYEPLAVGIWFVYRGVQFFIATDPGMIKEKIFGINDTSFFELEPDNAVFKQHDYYERVMNTMVQLLRNLYIYSRLDDPDFFMKTMTTIQTDAKYEIAKARRRISAFRDFKQDLFSYCDSYPSFFTELTPEMRNGADPRLPRMILDSKKTYKGLYQQLIAVQKLKENIFGASGSKIEVTEPQNDQEIRTVSYTPYFKGILYANATTTRITDEMIKNIVRLEQYYKRPGYIEEYYVYPSDYTVRGPDQHIFMSEDEIKQYMNLLELETTNAVITAPIPASSYLTKTPIYIVLRDSPTSKDGSLYILQNVLGGSRRRVLNVLYAWDRERINLGYFAEEYAGSDVAVDQINFRDLNGFDTNINSATVEYFSGQYAALFRLSGSVSL